MWALLPIRTFFMFYFCEKLLINVKIQVFKAQNWVIIQNLLLELNYFSPFNNSKYLSLISTANLACSMYLIINIHINIQKEKKTNKPEHLSFWLSCCQHIAFITASGAKYNAKTLFKKYFINQNICWEVRFPLSPLIFRQVNTRFCTLKVHGMLHTWLCVMYVMQGLRNITTAGVF